MIPAVIRKIDEAVKSYQPTVDTWGDGLARREFMFAEDLADFILFSLDHFDKVPNIMNVGLDYDYSINDYYEAVADVIGYTGTFEHDLTKPAGMKQKLVDINQQANLGWTPKTDLTQGIRLTYQHYLNEVL